MLIDSSGRQDQISCFSYDEKTEIYGSCSLTWQNNFYVFGGETNIRQISKVIDKKLTKIGSLDFDHRYGACSVMGMDELYLCFNYANRNESSLCRTSENPLGEFYEIVESNYEHRLIKTAASDCKLVKPSF